MASMFVIIRLPRNYAYSSKLNNIIVELEIDQDSLKTEPEQTKQNTKSLRRSYIKIGKWIVTLLVIVAISGFAFVKLDTPLAARITDKYMRPIFGDKLVIYMEKVFFDISDQTTKIVYDFKKPKAPNFNESGTGNQLPTFLNLSSIPVSRDFLPLPGEGVWHNIPLNTFPQKEVMAYTFVRPDPTRTFAITSIVKMDTSTLALGSVAGTVEPGGPVGKYGSGRVPKNIVQSGNLIAAFDGGFQYKDGAYGMVVGDTTYLPLKNNMGTIVGYKDGSIKILDYSGEDLGKDVAFARQNGPMLIKDGNVTVTDPDSIKVWGRVIGTDTFTWRSGIGITADGDLLFAAGNNLNPLTLAEALKMAGAVNAIQLDINPYWVRFNIFNSVGSGQYDSTPLNKDMQDGSKEYLNGYQKDFFYVYKK